MPCGDIQCGPISQILQLSESRLIKVRLQQKTNLSYKLDFLEHLKCGLFISKICDLVNASGPTQTKVAFIPIFYRMHHVIILTVHFLLHYPKNNIL